MASRAQASRANQPSRNEGRRKEGPWFPAGTLLCLIAVLPTSTWAAENPSPPLQLSTEAIVQRLLAANAWRAEALRGYRGKRLYSVDYHGFLGARAAQMQVEATYVAPNKKDFKIISQSGSKLLLNRVVLKLLDSEKEALKDEIRLQTELSSRNYEFALTETQHTADGDFYVLAVTPREKSKFLYRGKIWVEARDFAVARIEGEPAKNPSFWISHTQIEHRYTKVGDFWLPAHNQSITQVRLGGKAVLTIDYTDYEITPPPKTPVRDATSAASK